MKQLLRRVATMAAPLVLTGCAVDSYVPPAPGVQPPPMSTPAPLTLSRTIDKPIGAVWQSILKHSHQNGFGVKATDRAKGTLSVWLPAFEPSQYITCGTVRVQDGSFTTYTRLIHLLAEHADTYLDIRADVSLRSIAANKTEVRVMAHYTFRVGFNTTATGAMVDGQVYRFNSNSAASVSMTMPHTGAPAGGLCEPTGAAEQAILRAASR